jgi:hypothetical protein
MAKIYEFSAWRDAKSIAKSFSLAEIEKEVKSLESYIVSESCASESCAPRLSVWKLAYKISKGATLK